MVTVKKIIEDLEKLEEKYNNLRSSIMDDMNYDRIEEAKEKFKEVQSLKEAIEQMENLEVKI